MEMPGLFHADVVGVKLLALRVDTSGRPFLGQTRLSARSSRDPPWEKCGSSREDTQKTEIAEQIS